MPEMPIYNNYHHALDILSEFIYKPNIVMETPKVNN